MPSFADLARAAADESRVDILQGRYREAAARLEPLLARLESEDLGDNPQALELDVRGTLGSALGGLGRGKEATALLERCLEITRAAGVPGPLAATLHELAFCYLRQGQRDVGVRLCEEAAALAIEHDLNVASLYLLAIFRYEDRRFEEAGDLLEHARDYYENRNDLVGLGRVLNELALVSEQLGNVQGAIEYASQSIRLKHQIGDEAGAQHTLHNLLAILGRHPELLSENSGG